MIIIGLFCTVGISTSILVSKMQKIAKTKGIDAKIETFPEGKLSQSIDAGIDVALLGPQAKYTLNRAKKICDSKGIPVDVINPNDYSLMNSEKVLDFALELLGR